MYQWDFGWVWTYRAALIAAAWVTIKLNVVVLVLGSVLGMIIAACRGSRFAVVRYLAIAYVDVFRTIPILVLLIWAFFCIPVLVRGAQFTPWTCAVAVLSINLSAFAAEIIRAGIEAVPTTLVEGGLSCGLSQRQTLRFVVLPIAIRNMIPPLVGQYINSIKLSVLASVIAVPELLQKTTDLASQVYRPLEFYTALAVAFLVLLLPGTIWSRRLETKEHVERRSAET